MTKLEELKAALEAATPGEWKPCRSHEDFHGSHLDIDPDEIAEYEAEPFVTIAAESRNVANAHDLFTFHTPDANFIALAHNLMPQLLEAVELLNEYDAWVANLATEEQLDRRDGRGMSGRCHTLLEKLK